MRGLRAREIAALDAERDFERIAFLLSAYEFPWDIERSLEFALFRTYAVPSISGLLARTGEFERRPRKRYDDTELILSEILENGLDSPRGRAALARMNAMHGRFAIANADMLYVLSTFLFEPIRWLERFGWRTLTDHEKQASLNYYRELGRAHGHPAASLKTWTPSSNSTATTRRLASDSRRPTAASAPRPSISCSASICRAGSSGRDGRWRAP